MYKDLVVLGIVVMGFILLILCCGIMNVFMIEGARRDACHVFGTESGRDVKVVSYGYVGSDCLTKQKDGTWISTYNLRGE